MIFADVRLPGAMDGIDLAWEVKLRWPLLPMDSHIGGDARMRPRTPGRCRLHAQAVATAQRADRGRTGASV